MNALDILRAGRALLDDPTHWTQGAFSRFQDGEAALWDMPSAVSFCTMGAIFRVDDRSSLRQDEAAGKYLAAGFGVADVDQVLRANDHNTHAEVLAAWDRAIALAEEQEFGAPLPPVETPEPVLASA